MEREIVELRNQLAAQAAVHSPGQSQRQPQQMLAPALGLSTNGGNGNPFGQNMPQIQSNLDQYMGSSEAVASLLDLKSGVDSGAFPRSPNGLVRSSRIIEDVHLVPDRVKELFDMWVPRRQLPPGTNPG
jgi:hypothetical protein